jgi:hypothetical protein
MQAALARLRLRLELLDGPATLMKHTSECIRVSEDQSEASSLQRSIVPLGRFRYFRTTVFASATSLSTRSTQASAYSRAAGAA